MFVGVEPAGQRRQQMLYASALDSRVGEIHRYA